MNASIKYYELLGLKEGAGPLEVKQAFRELAFQFHPDRNPHNPQAEEKFKQIAQAYAFLSGNQEMFRALENSKATRQELSRFVSDIFGDIFSVEAHLLPPRILSDWEQACAICQGSGSSPGSSPRLCTYCFGEGFVWINSFQTKVKKQCPKCLGRGKISLKACAKCHGRGVVKRPTFTFDGASNLCEFFRKFFNKIKQFFSGS